ncbi:hypothetical protein [Mycobacterium sp. SMC-4]|uniref:hypothetical protein n=1 Tax=Mycobacterium sp. SMC-4 TaxID=2857059 RepID=UPI003CFE3207
MARRGALRPNEAVAVCAGVACSTLRSAGVGFAVVGAAADELTGCDPTLVSGLSVLAEGSLGGEESSTSAGPDCSSGSGWAGSGSGGASARLVSSRLVASVATSALVDLSARRAARASDLRVDRSEVSFELGALEVSDELDELLASPAEDGPSSAAATPAPANSAAPIPSATARPPTRPMYAPAPMG